MTHIKGVIFDFGGVISHPQDQRCIDQILDLLQVTDRDRFHQVYMDLRMAYDGGHMSAAQYWDTLINTLGCTRVPVDALIRPDIQCWTAINEDTLDFAADLRDHGIVTAVLSNMNVDVLAYLEEEYSWIHDFDHLVYSCDLGVCKPQKEIYDYCVSRMGLTPSECLFLDDSPVNVHAAVEYGIHAAIFEGHKTLKSIKEAYFCNIFADKKTQ